METFKNDHKILQNKADIQVSPNLKIPRTNTIICILIVH